MIPWNMAKTGLFVGPTWNATYSGTAHVGSSQETRAELNKKYKAKNLGMLSRQEIFKL